MGETRQKTGHHQGSTGFKITIKILGAIHRWLYRVSGGKWEPNVLRLSYTAADHYRA